MSENFCTDSDKCNIELVDALRPFLKWFLIVLNGSFFAIIVISYWKPWLAKYYLHLIILHQMALETLPADYGSMHIEYNETTMILYFINFSFTWWREIIHVAVFNVYTMLVH